MKRMSVAELMEMLRAKIESKEFLTSARKKDSAFTRKRRMPFCDIIFFMCGSLRRSVQRELELYFQKKGGTMVSRQAFAIAREQIRPEALRSLNDTVIEKFETEDETKETYKGYRLIAVDGSIIDLPNTKAMQERFGFSSNDSGKVFTKGMAMAAFDVLNKITIFAELYRYDESERKRILDIVDGFAELPYYQKSIFLLDRGYPSFQLFQKMTNHGQNFVIRVSANTLKEVRDCSASDKTIEIIRDNIPVTLRVVNIILSTGETVKLVTNLSEEFTIDDLKELYARRWGVETQFNFVKNKEMLESFTGESETAVLQDFYIGILILNVTAVAYREQKQIITRKAKKAKHVYKPNKTQLIADLKTNWVRMMLGQKSSFTFFRELNRFARIKRYAYAEIPGRHFDRPTGPNRSTRSTHPKSPF